jgi:hypothetical protein
MSLSGNGKQIDQWSGQGKKEKGQKNGAAYPEIIAWGRGSPKKDEEK